MRRPSLLEVTLFGALVAVVAGVIFLVWIVSLVMAISLDAVEIVQ